MPHFHWAQRNDFHFFLLEDISRGGRLVSHHPSKCRPPPRRNFHPGPIANLTMVRKGQSSKLYRLKSKCRPIETCKLLGLNFCSAFCSRESDPEPPASRRRKRAGPRPLSESVSGPRRYQTGKNQLILSAACFVGFTLTCGVPLSRKENVLINDNGDALLMDFGLAMVMEENSLYSSSYREGGSVRWMAPELLLNNKVTRSCNTDVYSYGGVAFEVRDI